MLTFSAPRRPPARNSTSNHIAPMIRSAPTLQGARRLWRAVYGSSSGHSMHSTPAGAGLDAASSTKEQHTEAGDSKHASSSTTSSQSSSPVRPPRARGAGPPRGPRLKLPPNPAPFTTTPPPGAQPFVQSQRNWDVKLQPSPSQKRHQPQLRQPLHVQPRQLSSSAAKQMHPQPLQPTHVQPRQLSSRTAQQAHTQQQQKEPPPWEAAHSSLSPAATETQQNPGGQVAGSPAAPSSSPADIASMPRDRQPAVYSATAMMNTLADSMQQGEQWLLREQEQRKTPHTAQQQQQEQEQELPEPTAPTKQNQTAQGASQQLIPARLHTAPLPFQSQPNMFNEALLRQKFQALQHSKQQHDAKAASSAAGNEATRDAGSHAGTHSDVAASTSNDAIRSRKAASTKPRSARVEHSSSSSAASIISSSSPISPTSTSSSASIRSGSQGSFAAGRSPWQQPMPGRPVQAVPATEVARLSVGCMDVNQHWSLKWLMRPECRLERELWLRGIDKARALAPAVVEATEGGPYKLFFFDLETNGLPTQAEILEICVRSEHPSAPIFHTLVRPVAPIDKVATAIHHITAKMVMHRDVKPWPVVGVELLQWLSAECSNVPGGRCTPVFVAHNASFDRMRLGHWLGCLGFKVPYTWLCFDTLGLSRHVRPWPPGLNKKGSGFHTLQYIYASLGYPQTANAHRADADVHKLYAVFHGLAEMQLGQSLLLDGPTRTEQLEQLLDRDRSWFTGFVAVKTKAVSGTQPPRRGTAAGTRRSSKGAAGAGSVAGAAGGAKGALKPPVAAATAATAADLPPIKLAPKPVRKSPPVPAKDAEHLATAAAGDEAVPAEVGTAPAGGSAVADVEAAAAPVAQQRKPPKARASAKPAGSKVAEVVLQEEAPAAETNAIEEGVSAADALRLEAWSGTDPAADIEAAVRDGLAALSPEDLAFDGPELQSVWWPVTAPVASLKKVFTSGQLDKLSSAGFSSLLQVLLYAPRKVEVYRNTLIDEPEQLIAMPAMCKAVYKPMTWGSGGWRLSGKLEVPAEHAPEGTAIIDFCIFSYVRYNAGRKILADVCDILKVSKDRQVPVMIRGKVKSDDKPGVYKAVGNLEVTPVDSTATTTDAAAKEPQLIPVYSARTPIKPEDFPGSGTGSARGIIPRALAAALEEGCAGAEDVLPDEVLQQQALMGWPEALRVLHGPADLEEYEAACRRLAFQETFLVQLACLLERQQLTRANPVSAVTAPAAGVDPSTALQEGPVAAASLTNLRVMNAAWNGLPYTLTPSQQRVLQELLNDLSGDGDRSMLRLLQGDVGCGKTIVAVLALLAAFGSGWQGAIMAPTELLADQHYRTLLSITDALPLALRPRVASLSRSLKVKERREVQARIASGEVDLVVGTHAVLWQAGWSKLGLVVVDEQHKFGVKEREKLRALSPQPHMLLMTATPIPRTMALVQYGEMMHSSITEMPPGRLPIATMVVQDTEDGREQVYAAIREELSKGGRIYIVCPLVTESDAGSFEGVTAAREEYERLQAVGVFGEHQCALLHGQMKGEEKSAVLQAFRSGETPVLIASTVVEVGVDVPEASIMLVENAERFGLAQLHQLRGRIGRGQRASRCFLMGPTDNEEALDKLRVLERYQNGLQVAEEDLKLRGPGDMLGWGTRQSGKSGSVSALCFAQLQKSPYLVEHARAAAAGVLVNGGAGLTPRLKAALLAYGLWADDRMVVPAGLTKA